MTGILLTKSGTPIIGWIASILGLIMEGIFNILDLLGIPNIGLSIILFTIVIYLMMLPLTIKQQKFSKLSAKMNPELQAISKKYKNRKDNDSMMQMNAETQAVYAKYGVSPTGTCLPMLIQMPILLALYQVIYRMPAYVRKIGNVFGVLADKIIEKGLVDEVKNFTQAAAYAKNFDIDQRKAIIDVLNKVNSADLVSFAQQNGFADLQFNGHHILAQGSERGLLDIYNNFLGLNIANSPASIVKTAMEAGAWALVIAAIAIPVLSAVTQWINVKLMPQQERSKDGSNEMADTMASSMKTMNMVMPILSAVFCYTLPAGMGLYWVAGSVVRSIQQVIINKHIDKMDLNEIIEKNKDKSARKMEKVKANQAKLQQYANMSTKGIGGTVNTKNYSQKAKEAADKAVDKEVESGNASSASAKPGSLMARANMVKDYNVRNNREKK
ncbi:MAG: YidC/Oxa1 family membrane protein insertase [Lachnospiraceae bacterium]|nr:YidC/Oxa1 family membrane protein insertase [Lachnospiraceae bacterium]